MPHQLQSLQQKALLFKNLLPLSNLELNHFKVEDNSKTLAFSTKFKYQKLHIICFTQYPLVTECERQDQIRTIISQFPFNYKFSQNSFFPSTTIEQKKLDTTHHFLSIEKKSCILNNTSGM